MPVPSRLDTAMPLRSLSQPGSRLHYISATGDDATGEIYFWDGARIVDSQGRTADAMGTSYGTDPMNPSAAVKAFRRWSHVAPRDSGEDIGSPVGTPGSYRPRTRAGYPDWWLFKRGETFNLGDDMLSWARQTNPAATTAAGSLAVPGGRSATERQVVGAYGELCQPRPRFTHPFQGFVYRVHSAGYPVFGHVAYLSLHFDGHDRLPDRTYAGYSSLYHPSTSSNILFEDMWFDAARVTVQDSAQIKFRRILVTDVFSADGSHIQGIFYAGTRSTRLTIEDSILLRNGFSQGDVRNAWPPAPPQIWDVFNRNLYIAGELDHTGSAMTNSVSMLGASGDQFRPGMHLQQNFFYQGYVQMGGAGGYPLTEPATGSITDNVLQRFVGTGTAENRGHPGWGLQLSSGAQKVQVTGNIVTSAQHAGAGSAFQLTPLNWFCYHYVFRQPTRNNQVSGNIFEAPLNTAVLSVVDGVTGEETPGCSGWVSPGVTGNILSDNTLIGTQAYSFTLVGATGRTGRGGGTPAVSDTVVTNNRLYSSRAAAAAALGWPQPNATLKTYLQAMNVPVSSADGLLEYHLRATQLRRGQWAPGYLGKDIVNHVRTGFAMQPLP